MGAATQALDYRAGTPLSPLPRLGRKLATRSVALMTESIQRSRSKSGETQDYQAFTSLDDWLAMTKKEKPERRMMAYRDGSRQELSPCDQSESVKPIRTGGAVAISHSR